MWSSLLHSDILFFFFHDTATTEIYTDRHTLSLHDSLPILFGIIQKASHRWEGTKVHIKHGLLKPGKIVIPGALLDLFREKAMLADDFMTSMSPAQRAKVDKHVMDNREAFAASDQFAAITDRKSTRLNSSH